MEFNYQNLAFLFIVNYISKQDSLFMLAYVICQCVTSWYFVFGFQHNRVFYTYTTICEKNLKYIIIKLNFLLNSNGNALVLLPVFSFTLLSIRYLMVYLFDTVSIWNDMHFHLLLLIITYIYEKTTKIHPD